MNNKLYVGNLPYETSEKSLEELFESYGKVVSLKIIRDENPFGKKRVYGFVEFSTVEEANNAMALNEQAFGTESNKRKLIVGPAMKKS